MELCLPRLVRSCRGKGWSTGAATTARHEGVPGGRGEEGGRGGVDREDKVRQIERRWTDKRRSAAKTRLLSGLGGRVFWLNWKRGNKIANKDVKEMSSFVGSRTTTTTKSEEENSESQKRECGREI